MFHEWVVTDPKAAIQQAKKLDHLDQRIALEAILQFKEDLDYDQFADISQEVGHTDIGDKFRKRFAIGKSIGEQDAKWLDAFLKKSTSLRNRRSSPSTDFARICHLPRIPWPSAHFGNASVGTPRQGDRLALELVAETSPLALPRGMYHLSHKPVAPCQLCL